MKEEDLIIKSEFKDGKELLTLTHFPTGISVSKFILNEEFKYFAITNLQYELEIKIKKYETIN